MEIGEETKPTGHHFHSFLLECLADLDDSLQKIGSKLHIFIGDPVAVFRHLHANYSIDKICFEHDCEPIWHARDNAVKGTNLVLFLFCCLQFNHISNYTLGLCSTLGIECVEKVSHTLWDPVEIIQANGGTPPLAYDQFAVTIILILI